MPIGRSDFYGLANAGAMNVAHVRRLLRDERQIAMALCGIHTLDDASPALLDGPSFETSRPENSNSSHL